MDRRKFLSLTLAALAAFILPTRSQAMAPSLAYKGTCTGQILGRTRTGDGWERKANFGPDYSILGVYQGPGWLIARVQYRGMLFHLKSMDGTTWYTAEYSPPTGDRA